MIDAYSSMAHYAEHLLPVWRALPEQVRGTFWCPSRTEVWGTPLHRGRDVGRLVLVAAWRDAQQVAPSPLVYVEHGAGQTYDADERAIGNGSYAGGAGLGRVRLFVAPNDDVADRWQARYPAPVAVVGCPKLDRWHLAEFPQDGNLPTVAVAFHWECPLVPETRSAWRHYDRMLPALVGDGRWRLLGHGHPRLWGAIRRRWRQLGADHTPDLADVFNQADLLVADNTSAAYEFASLGRPVVVLNAPWYRRDVHHGLRFWSHPPGLQVDQPRDLPDAIAHALTDPPAARAIRAAAVARAYAHVDGRAAERAANAIMEVADAR